MQKLEKFSFFVVVDIFRRYRKGSIGLEQITITVNKYMLKTGNKNVKICSESTIAMLFPEGDV